MTSPDNPPPPESPDTEEKSFVHLLCLSDQEVDYQNLIAAERKGRCALIERWKNEVIKRVESDDPAVRLQAASEEGTIWFGREGAAELLTDPDPRVRAAFAAQKALFIFLWKSFQKEIITLAHDPDYRVRGAIAGNWLSDRLPPREIDLLSQDPDESVRYSLAKQPVHLLHHPRAAYNLMSDSSERVRKVIPGWLRRYISRILPLRRWLSSQALRT